MREQPVEARAQKNNCVGVGEHKAACRGCAQRVVVGQQSFGHRHWQIGNPALLDKLFHRLVHLRVGCALADDYKRLFCLRQQRHCALHSLVRGYLSRRGFYGNEECLLRILGVHSSREHCCGNVKIDSAGAAREGGAHGTRNSRGNVLGAVDAVGCLCKGLCDVHLVQPLVVALLQVDDVAVARPANLYHGESVDSGTGECREPVQESRRRHCEAYSRLSCEESAYCGCVPRRLLVTESNVSYSHLLCASRKVGDGDSHYSENSLNAVHLQCIHHQVHAIGYLILFSCHNFLFF